MKTSKIEKVKNDLLKGIRVDQRTVILKYAAYRLSSIIGVLRDRGMNIITVTPSRAIDIGIITKEESLQYDSPTYGFYYMTDADRKSYIETHNQVTKNG